MKNAETREKPNAREKRSNAHEKRELAQVCLIFLSNWLKLAQVGSSWLKLAQVKLKQAR